VTLPVATVQVDHVAATGRELLDGFDAVTGLLATILDKAVRSVAENPNHTAAEFWQRQGTNGVAVLTEFAYWRAVLQAKSPEKITAAIAAAGSTLVTNQDGTVTLPN